MTEPLTPDAVRALIADADGYAGMDEYPGAVLIRELAAALTALLPREDADLDAIESRAAWAGSYSNGDLQGSVERFRIVREDVPALIARVRTAEAERDAARKAALTEALDAIADSAPSMDEEHHQAHVAYMAVGALLGAEFPFPASRTVETAEEWEYAIRTTRHDLGGGVEYDSWKTTRRDHAEQALAQRRRLAEKHAAEWSYDLVSRRPAGTWAPVPPIPEEAAHP